MKEPCLLTHCFMDEEETKCLNQPQHCFLSMMQTTRVCRVLGKYNQTPEVKDEGTMPCTRPAMPCTRQI